jgi:hypothetical protein
MVGEQVWFYRNDDEWTAMAERLKQTPCPHCKVVGMLIRHGFLRGYDDQRPAQKNSLRARRIFCSNRHQRRGCGHTFSVWLADKIRRLSLSTRMLWGFLQQAANARTIADAIRDTQCQGCDKTWYRLWKRFEVCRTRIRTQLLRRCPPPPLPESPRPAAQDIAHLAAAFPNADCPLAAYQRATRTFFV